MVDRAPYECTDDAIAMAIKLKVYSTMVLSWNGGTLEQQRFWLKWLVVSSYCKVVDWVADEKRSV